MPDPLDVTIRMLVPADLDAWWDMRLEALRDHPTAFGSDYETAKRQGPSGNIERLLADPGTSDRVVIAIDGTGRLLATAGLVRESGKRSHIGFIWGVYTRPEARGYRLAMRLIDVLIDHAGGVPGIRQLHITVEAGNAGALKTYQRLGFVEWGRELRAIAWDGAYFDEIHLALMLDQADTTSTVSEINVPTDSP